jgi:hypothetical protein
LDECRVLERRTCRGGVAEDRWVGEEIFGGVIFLDVIAGCDEYIGT